MEGEWSAFNEIIRRKDCAIQVQVASLQVKIVAEDKAVEARTNDVLVEWEKSKPVEVSALKKRKIRSQNKIFFFFF